MSTLTALGIVQEFCALQGLPVPSALVGSSEKSVAQYRAILREVVRELLTCAWEEQKVRATFTAETTNLQGPLTTLFPGFEELIRDTFWSVTNDMRVTGPVTDSEWAAILALDISAPPYSYWIGGGSLYLSPIPSSGESFSAIYRTSYGFTSSGSPSASLVADADTLNFPDNVLLAGFEALWKEKKGLPYQTARNRFDDYLAKAQAPVSPRFQLDSPPPHNGPRVFIPPGSWNVT